MSEFLVPAICILALLALAFAAPTCVARLRKKTAATMATEEAETEAPEEADDGDDDGGDNDGDGNSAFDEILVGEADCPIVAFSAATDDDAKRVASGEFADIGAAPISAELAAKIAQLPVITSDAGGNVERFVRMKINGRLMRESSGTGLRAFARKGGKLLEQTQAARPGVLDVVNAVAVWQLATMLVGQKQLGAINRKLGEISEGIERIGAFLENQRKARIIADHSYLKEVHHAMSQNEFSDSVRNQIESIEREMFELQNHLLLECRQLTETGNADELFGTANQHKKLMGEICAMNERVHELALCLQTRIVAWHVLSLFPNEERLKAARFASIKESIEELRQTAAFCDEANRERIREIRSRFNKEKTLLERRRELKDASGDFLAHTLEMARERSEEIEQCRRLLESDETLLLRLSGDTVSGVYQVAEAENHG